MKNMNKMKSFFSILKNMVCHKKLWNYGGGDKKRNSLDGKAN